MLLSTTNHFIDLIEEDILDIKSVCQRILLLRTKNKSKRS